MSTTLSSSAQKVQDALKALGYENQVIEHDQTTRTAQEAADTIGCTVGQIVKSLIFKGKTSDKPVLIVASGPNRVDEKIIKQHLGEKITRPDADYVREHTGYAIGGIPPVGLPQTITTFIDQDLKQYTEIWAAAGTPRAVFKLTPQELVAMTGGTVIEVS
jgi:prolyl-tRNA editing enzyme YbaK/EbsC (Cys-tRNA(Pro) deacylase)